MTRDEFSTLALGYMDQVMAYARRLAGNPWDADDLLQGTYERAFESWEALRDVASCRAWLFRIAHNLFIDTVRASSARPELHLVDASDDPLPEPAAPTRMMDHLDTMELESAIERLPHDQQEAVLLSDLWGFRYEEIANVLGIPIGTVRSRIARGRVKLLERLDLEAKGRGSARRSV